MSQDINKVVEEVRSENTCPSAETNDHSIYDYLSKNPSVFIAVFSALVAIITFFARCITVISIRKNLAFWEIDSIYASFGSNSTIFSAIAAILYSFGIMLVSFWFATTYDAYLPYKKYNLLLRHWIKRNKARFKTIKKKSSTGDATEEELDELNQMTLLRNSAKVIARASKKHLLWNLIPVFLLTYVVFLLYYGICFDHSTNRILGTAFISTSAQTIILWLIAQAFSKETIGRKKIKVLYDNTDNFSEILINCAPNSTFPIKKLLKNGFRSMMNNVIIVLFVIVIFLNCSLVAIMYVITPASPRKPPTDLRISTIDSIPYAVVYQIDNRYFLEEADILQKTTDGKTEYNLTVYTNRQRILSTDNISFSVYSFDSVVKEHKQEKTTE